MKRGAGKAGDRAGFNYQALERAADAAGYDGRRTAQALETDAATVWRWFHGERVPNGADTCRMMHLFGLAASDLVADIVPNGTTGRPAAPTASDPAPPREEWVRDFEARIQALEALLLAKERRPG